MKIVDKRPNPIVPFADIEIAGLFCFGGHFFMRMEELIVLQGTPRNAVRLDDGIQVNFTGTTKVTAVDGEFHVRSGEAQS